MFIIGLISDLLMLWSQSKQVKQTFVKEIGKNVGTKISFPHWTGLGSNPEPQRWRHWKRCKMVRKPVDHRCRQELYNNDDLIQVRYRLKRYTHLRNSHNTIILNLFDIIASLEKIGNCHCKKIQLHSIIFDFDYTYNDLRCTFTSNGKFCFILSFITFVYYTLLFGIPGLSLLAFWLW